MAQNTARRTAPARDAGLAVGLLGIGVVHVTYSVATLRDLTGLFDAQNAALGLHAFAQPAVAATAGWIAAAALVLSLALAIGFAVPRIRTGRPSWWIPVLCAAIGWTVVAAVSIAAWVADPAVAAKLVQGGS